MLLMTPPAMAQAGPVDAFRGERAADALTGAQAWLLARPEVPIVDGAILAPDLALGRLRARPLLEVDVQTLGLRPADAWALVNRAGEVLLKGPGAIPASQVRDAMGPVLKPTPEAWLTSHRGCGQVERAQLHQAMAEALTLPEGPLAALQGPNRLRLGRSLDPIRRAMERLMEVPGWADSPVWATLGSTFPMAPAALAEVLSPISGRMREDLLDALVRNGPSDWPWAYGISVMKALGHPISLAEAEALLPLDSALSQDRVCHLNDHFLANHQPQAALALVRRAREAWERERRSLDGKALNPSRVALAFDVPTVVAHLSLGQRMEARQALERLRSQGGPRWVHLKELVRTHPEVHGNAEALALIQDLLNLPPLSTADPLPPPPPPLRLVGLGPVPAPAQIRRQPPVADFLDLELSVTLAPEAEAQRLRKALNLGAQPAWVLFRGTDVLGSQPATAPLEQLLPSQAPRLVRLRTRVRTNPEDAGARHTLLNLLAARLPVLPDLESELRRLAQAAPETLPMLTFPVRETEAWRRVAQAAMNTLRAQLHAWPDREDLWRAWFAWSPFSTERTADLLSDLTKPLDLDTEGTCLSTSLVPDRVWDTVGLLLDTRERWASLAQWESAWWTQVAEPRRGILAALPPHTAPRRAMEAHAARYVRALSRLGDDKALQAFEATLKTWREEAQSLR